jgi:hypothetical protein
MKKRDLGMTFEEASVRSDFFSCYQILGKFYTAKTAHTAPNKVQLGQCPVCAQFTWNEMETQDFGSCSSCGFFG